MKQPRRLTRTQLSPAERITLLALVLGNSRGIKKTDHLWVQKVVFLFRRLLESVDASEGPEAAGYLAYDLGPYSEEVEGSIATLLEDGLLTVGADKVLQPSSDGERLAREIAAERPKGASAIQTILELVDELKTEELILYVYATSPEWAKASKIAHITENRTARIDLGLKLYHKGKISVERAAEVAGLTIPGLLNESRKRQG